MGMAASQGRLLTLINRSNDIGQRLAECSNSKVSLTRDMQKITKEYQNALNQKVLKWSNNAGASYVDISYKNIMKPSAMNLNKPYLLTDLNDKIVVDSQYKEYAEMISPNGRPNGDWNSVRTEILSSITGIDAEKINNANSYQNAIGENENIVNSLIDSEPIKPVTNGSVNDFISNLDNKGITDAFTDGSTFSDAYSRGGNVKLGDTNAVKNFEYLLNSIATSLGKYIDDPENLKSACDTFYNSNVAILQNPDSYKTSLESEATPLSQNSNGGFEVDVTIMLDTIIGSYSQLNGHIDKDVSGNYKMSWNDIDSEQYKEWKAKHDEWKAGYDSAMETYNEAVKSNNQLFTAEEESLIKFYDAIFSAIAEKGWTYNGDINDTEYLNQMLQNNLYTMTTVERGHEYDTDSGELVWDNNYSTDIASNFKNIFIVNDSDARDEALTIYENKKAIINNKESKVDTRMRNLETELSAIKQMMQSVEEQIGKNIETNMSTFA